MPQPAAVPLFVEVAQNSLPQDRTTKGTLYARADIAEYRIIHLHDKRVEVHTKPEKGL